MPFKRGSLKAPLCGRDEKQRRAHTQKSRSSPSPQASPSSAPRKLQTLEKHHCKTLWALSLLENFRPAYEIENQKGDQRWGYGKKKKDNLGSSKRWKPPPSSFISSTQWMLGECILEDAGCSLHKLELTIVLRDIINSCWLQNWWRLSNGFQLQSQQGLHHKRSTKPKKG